MMLAPILSSANSCVVLLSTTQASKISTRYGNGEFGVSMENTLRVQKVVKVCPIRVWMPNVFNNVNEFNNTFRVQLIGTPEFFNQDFVLPTGFYTAEEFCVMFNTTTANVSGLSLTVTGQGVNNQKINMVGDGNLELLAPVEFFDLIGYQDLTITSTQRLQGQVPGDLFTRSLVLKDRDPATTPAITVPNFGGTKVVHIAASPSMCPSNVVDGNGHVWDILISMSLADTPYGEYALYQAPDTFVDDYEHHSSINITNNTITVLDHKYRQLKIPTNYHWGISLKAYHVDTSQGR
jgi:hypothetical protein